MLDFNELNLLRNSSLYPELSPQLHVVQEQLSSFQQYHVETLALKAGYLKRTASSRFSKSIVPPLEHPSLNRVCQTKEKMLDSDFIFYDKLYSPDPIDFTAAQSLLKSIPPSACISASDSALLVERITFDELVEAFSHFPTTSSPGLDGLSYEIAKLIILHPSCREIALQAFNDALQYGIFPSPWLHTSVFLLPKKGDLSGLKNWRSISLINTDAKVFTRILNARFLLVTDDLINTYQLGFVRGRFITDNGLLVKLLMERARLIHSPAIALLLDQEKAYDRVHP
ncbi:hypothetical protein A0J61_04126 [Choanephora cucurbitarum]|uniref:Reverse transcriptase domain-containing protein n=1 Tax=Choanephora cucurbitarum TaxID=101091 RepID=A0A1C7NFE0_9FUNG|nr:hypothetical protein A0J61_04126 [Choanephora cucurbitarum]